MSISTDRAFLNRITGASTGRSHRIGFVFMLTLCSVFYLRQAAADTDIQNFTVHLAGSVPNHDLLHSVAQRVHVIPLFNFTAVYTQITVIAQSQTARSNALDKTEVMVISARITAAAISATVRLLTIAVGVATAAGAALIFRLPFISQPYISHTAFHHFSAIVVLVCNLEINNILTFIRKIWSRG